MKLTVFGNNATCPEADGACSCYLLQTKGKRILLDMGNGSAAKLQKQHILIRDCSNYPGLDDNYVRLAVRNRQDNIHLLQAIKNVW